MTKKTLLAVLFLPAGCMTSREALPRLQPTEVWTDVAAVGPAPGSASADTVAASTRGYDFGDTTLVLAEPAAREVRATEAFSLPAFDLRQAAAETAAPPPVEDTGVPSSAQSDGWRFTLGLVGWLPRKFRGSTTLRGNKTKFDLDTQDILDNLDSVFEMGAEVGYKKWSLVSFGLYFKLGGDAGTSVPILGPINTKADVALTVVDVALAYELGTWSILDSPTATWSLDAVMGGRYQDISPDIRIKGPGPGFRIDYSQWWVDPVVGMRARYQLTRRLGGFLRADVGGFGIGSASTLSYNLVAAMDYRLGKGWSFLAAYRYLYINWSEHHGGNKEAYIFRVDGPMAGFTYRF